MDLMEFRRMFDAPFLHSLGAFVDNKEFLDKLSCKDSNKGCFDIGVPSEINAVNNIGWL